MKILLRCIIAFLFTSFIVTSCTNEPQDKAFYLFRHAEKELDEGNDNPPLTLGGEVQASTIAKILKDKEITAVYTTKYKRNLSTVQPLVDETGVKVYYYEWSSWKDVFDSIEMRKDVNIAICGHGDILLPMINELGATPPQKSIAKNEYKTIYHVVKQKDTSFVETMKF